MDKSYMCFVGSVHHMLRALSNRKRHVSINGYDSNLPDVKFSFPQGSVLGPLLFLIYINELNQALKLQMTQTYFILVNQFIDLINMLTLI